MNVYSYAPSEDINKTEGLCGTFDGDTSNDMRLRGSGRIGKLDEFIESWRIPKGESLFDNPTLGGEVSQRHVQYCKCLG
ncbi:hypothetical protein GH877_30835, partial [Bacillus thuringiensis]|nr:hypothetical protein [Bacillus thuringiensis]